ncbi:MAG: hypothetical protein CMJ58_03325 [Planctomycetaceae bacterium]|nr:hypothetical protein [Planctomycetaceae bacterium]
MRILTGTTPKRRQTCQLRLDAREQTAGWANIAITTRFTEATTDALRRESLQRKLRSEPVYTQQDNRELAISSFLAKAVSTSADA